MVLKFLGLPLKQIRTLLDRRIALAGTLRRQQFVLADKRRQLDAAIHAIRKAEQALASRREPDWELFKRIIREVEMQNDTDWGKKYYSPEAQAKIEARKAGWSPELQDEVTQEWNALLADVEATLGEPVTSPKAQALASRWRTLVEGFTGGDPEIQRGLNAMWADKANWPAGPAKQFAIRPEIQDFIMAAMKAQRT